MAYEKSEETVVQLPDDRSMPHLVAVPVQQSPTKRQLKDYSPSLQNAARALWGVNREIR